MASPISTSTGLGSGLDISSIVTALANADKSAKQTQIDTQTKLNTAKISGVGSLKSVLSTFQAALAKLNSTTSPAFSGFAATSSVPATLTATSDNTAVNGSYNVEVVNLATSSKLASALFSGGATSAIPAGPLTITQNSIDYNVTIPSGATLQSTRDAINSALQTKGISANIVTDSAGASRLVIGSTTTGAGSDLKVSGISGLEMDATAPLDTTDPASAGYIGALATDATIKIDGLTVTSKSNTVDQAVGGLSMTLVAKGTSTVTVATNTDGLKTALQSFVSAYNAVTTSINALTKATLDSDGKPTVAAALTGDSMPRTLISLLRNELVAPSASSQLSVLSQLGIQTSQSDGTLSFDSTKFASALNDKGLGGEVQKMFTGTNSTNGLLARMDAVINPYTKASGVLDARTTSLNSQKSNLADQQAALDLRMTILTASLTAKYNTMDLLVGQMKATASSITSFFTALNAQKSSS